MPLVVSTVEPTGMPSAAFSATNALLPLTRTRTLPATSLTTTVLPAVGVGGGAAAEVAVTVNVWLAGVASVFPAGSRARTWKLWTPAASGGATNGEVHGAKGAPSRLHSKLEPGSLAENVNVGCEFVVVPGGPEASVVCGGTVSTAMPYWLDVATLVSELVATVSV